MDVYIYIYNIYMYMYVFLFIHNARNILSFKMNLLNDS